LPVNGLFHVCVRIDAERGKSSAGESGNCNRIGCGAEAPTTDQAIADASAGRARLQSRIVQNSEIRNQNAEVPGKGIEEERDQGIECTSEETKRSRDREVELP
jgi:hypothetical protein